MKYFKHTLLFLLAVIAIMSALVVESLSTLASPPVNPTMPISAIHTLTHDYQLEIVEDSILIYDLNRYVGTIPFKDSSYDIDPLTTIIYDDNE